MSTKHTNHWREIVEIVGVVSIVAALLLLAWEVRQANRMAAVELDTAFRAEIRAIDHARLSDPDVARIFVKLAAPDAHLITATEESQMQGLARYYAAALDAVQNAHDHGQLSHAELAWHAQHLGALLEQFPGLEKHLSIAIADVHGAAGKAVYAALFERMQTSPGPR